MPKEEISPEKRYKFRDLKTYSSTEWLADNKKKYRQVFDRPSTTYIYAELAFHNKYFDIEDWEVHVELRCYAVKKQRKEICTLPFSRKVSKYDNIGYIREGWGNKNAGFFWKKGKYYWEAWIEGEKVSTKYFYVEDAGRPLSKNDNPYCHVDSLRVYEGPYDDIPEYDRLYMKRFNEEETRYVYAEVVLNNLLIHKEWHCELLIKFYNDAGELKGQVVRLHEVLKGSETLKITAGWGSNVKGSWRSDIYIVEIVFMDQALANKAFEIGDSFEEEGENEIKFNNYSIEEPLEGEYSRIKLFQVPKELCTAFQQYLLFFKDYVRGAKGKDIEYTVNQVSEGLEIYFDAGSEEDLHNLKEYFNEYLNFARQNFVGIINVEGNPQGKEIDILRMRIEMQVNNLNMELKYKDLHIKTLETTIEDAKKEKKILLETIEAAFQSRLDTKIQEAATGVKIVTSPVVQLRQDCKQLVQRNQIFEVFELLTDNTICKDGLYFNDLLLLQNQWAALSHEMQLGKVSYEMANTQRNFIIHSLLSFIDKIQ